jgi:uncharacterized protein (DUF1330 family)
MSDTRCYIVVFGAFSDFDKFMVEYQTNVGPLMDKFGGRYVLIGESLSVLEGDFPSGGGSVISVWPNRKAALAFWNAPALRKVTKAQLSAGALQVVLIDAPTLAGIA